MVENKNTTPDMTFIDTHTHIYSEEFDSDREATVQRALEAGIGIMLLPAIDPETYNRQEALWKSNPLVFRQMMGLHPTSVKEDCEVLLAETQRRLFDYPEKYVAVGEIGLDFYWDRTFENQQLDVLKRQMRWAQELHKPVVLHIRKAYEEMLGLLKELNQTSYSGVMHCFGGSINQALRAIEHGFHIGIGGVVTFKNAGMTEVVKAVPLERIVLETDSPYLAPVPYRGKRNESAYVVEVAKKVAELKGITLEQVAETTTHNAVNLFGLEI